MFEYNKENKTMTLVMCVVVLSIWQLLANNPLENSFDNRQMHPDNQSYTYSMKALGLFSVYSEGRFINSFNTVEYAMKAINRLNNASIIFNPINKEIYNAYKQFIVYKGSDVLESFDEFNEAYHYAIENTNSFVVDYKEKKLVFSNFDRSISWNDNTKQGDLFLVNQWNPITRDYEFENIVNLSAKEGKYIQPRLNDMLIDKKAYEDLYLMTKDAYEDGVTRMIIHSVFRSYEIQKHLYEHRVSRLMGQYDEETARKKAATVVAKPGTSEHQTGLGVDITTIDRNGNIHTLNEAFVNTPVGAWLKEHSWEYGYVVRYHGDKSHITGVIYEPWHIRYVGHPHAEMMYKLDFCLEEYLDYLAQEEKVFFEDDKGQKYNILFFGSIYSRELLSALQRERNIISISSDGKSGVILTTLD